MYFSYRHFLLAAFTFYLFGQDSLAECSSNQIELPSQPTIVFEGDSLTYGYDDHEKNGVPPINRTLLPRSSNPFPEEVAKLNPMITAVNRGFPGDRSKDGLKRWASERTSDLTVLMYGTNDFGNFGRLPEGPLTVEQFKHNLNLLIDRRSKGKILLLTPPPILAAEENREIESYRQAMRQIATERNIALLETSSMLQAVTPLWSDGLHLSAEANKVLAASILAKVCLH